MRLPIRIRSATAITASRHLYALGTSAKDFDEEETIIEGISQQCQTQILLMIIRSRRLLAKRR